MLPIAGTLFEVETVILSVAVALVAALLAGGRLQAAESIPFRGSLIIAAVLAPVAGVLLGVILRPAGLVYAVALAAGTVLAVACLMLERKLVGTGLVAAGLFLNALVVGVNGAMPVSASASTRAGVELASVSDATHHPATATTTLRVLGDVVPVPLPVRPEVISPGDLLVAAGLAQLVFMAVRPRRRRVIVLPADRDRAASPAPAESATRGELAAP